MFNTYLIFIFRNSFNNMAQAEWPDKFQPFLDFKAQSA